MENKSNKYISFIFDQLIILIKNLINKRCSQFYLILFIIFNHCDCDSFYAQSGMGQCYDPSFVEIHNWQYRDRRYDIISMKGFGDRVKTQYFEGVDIMGRSAYERYIDWAINKKIIFVSVVNYIDQNRTPVGLTIENGLPRNYLLSNKMDGLVLVYPSGEIDIWNLKENDLKIINRGIDFTASYNIRNSSWDLQKFIISAQNDSVSTFQSHLLIYNNNLEISLENSSNKLASRRFLAICKSNDNEVTHLLINCPYSISLYESAYDVLKFVNDFLDMDVVSMINLECGQENMLEVFISDCLKLITIRGTNDISKASNLLAYYFE